MERYYQPEIETMPVEELKKLQFTDFANMVLTVVEKYFEIQSPITLRPISEQTLEDFMEFTMEGGVFGKSNLCLSILWALGIRKPWQ